MSSVVLSSIASAFTAIVSLEPLAVIVVLALPVLMVMPLSEASPAFTVRVPVRPVALMSPTKLLTTWLELPPRDKVEFWGTEIALLPNSVKPPPS